MEKHAPKTVEDLVVHKKKVGEVRAWLQAQAQSGFMGGRSHLLLVTGAQPPALTLHLHLCPSLVSAQSCTG